MWFQHEGKKRGVGVDVGVGRLRRFPIPVITAEDDAKLTALVDHAILARGSGDESSTKALGAEIDQIVYRLFDLTPEEIQIIEDATK